MTKICSKCLLEKDINEFGKLNKSNKLDMQLVEKYNIFDLLPVYE